VGANVKYSKYKFDKLHLDLIKIFDFQKKNLLNIHEYSPKYLVYININLLYETLFYYPKNQELLNNFALFFSEIFLPWLCVL
jgi:hypothetical protein